MSGETIAWLFAYDLVVVVFVALFARSILTFFHPLFWYLIWHLAANTLRLLKLTGEQNFLYTDSVSFLPVTTDEIVRAMLWNDIALLMFLIGSVMGHMVKKPRADRARYLQPSMRTVKIVSLWMFPPGLVFFVLLRFVPRAVFDQLGVGSYAIIVGMWPLTLTCILIYFLGFRKILIVMAGTFLLVLALQGYHRFMVIIPSIYLALLYLLRSPARFKPLKLLIPSALLMFIMPYMKQMGRAFQAGDYAGTIDILFSALRFQGGASSPVNFLDQFAAALTLIDHSEKLWYGATYLNLLLLPIPRALWPDKPSLGQHVLEIATVDRPFDAEGRIITMLGESYINFGTAGIIIVPAIVAYLFTRLYLRFTRSPKYSLIRLFYLFVLPASVQMYRDGITSIVLFGLIFNMPLIFLWLGTRRNVSAGQPQQVQRTEIDA
ncbi:MAG: oligosaccharide repeat unit polymerase [Halioglobus sp.]